MSVKVMSWVLDHSETKLGPRLTLLALADHAQDDGGGAFPSQATLARYTRLTDRQVRRCLKTLEEGGSVARVGVSQHGTVVWKVLMEGVGQNVRGRTNRSGSRYEMSDEPSVNPPVETSPVGESKKTEREHPEFGQWIGRHHETFGDSVPRAGTQARARLAGAFRARRDEGLSLGDLLDVIEHVSVDAWHVKRGKHDATYLLRPSVSGRLVSAWRAQPGGRAASALVDAKWSAAMAANEELQRREAEELSA